MSTKLPIYFSNYPIVAGKRTFPVDRSYVKENKLKYVANTSDARIYEDKSGTQFGVFSNKD